MQASNEFKNLHIQKHPLIAHKLSLLRNKETSPKKFRELVEEITLLLGYEATQGLPLENVTIETPLTTMSAPHLATEEIIILPILRAGLGMVSALLALMPTARVGHIGVFRDEETFKPQHYYFKIPPQKPNNRYIGFLWRYFKIPPQKPNNRYIVCDPMLATGGSAVDAIDKLKQQGIKDIRMICIVAAPEGVSKMLEQHPDVPIYTANLDEKLNDKGYILPGLGDAGDRIFGTQ